MKISCNAFGRLLAGSGLIGLLSAAGVGSSFAQTVTTQFLPTMTTIAGNHAAGYGGDGGPALSATSSNVTSSAVVDAYGNIYVSDAGHTAIREVDAATGIINTVIGGTNPTVCPAPLDKFGDGCPGTNAVIGTATKSNGPATLRFFNGKLYFTDQTNSLVRVYDPTTKIVTVALGGGSMLPTVAGVSAGSVQLKSPQALAFDTAGNMYIAVAGGAPEVLKYNVSAGTVSIVAGTGTATKSGDGGPATQATVNTPMGLAVDTKGNIYIAEQSQDDVRRVDAVTGYITTYAGTQSTTAATGFAGDGGPASASLLNVPNNLSTDAQDNLYIADTKNFRIRKVTPIVGSTDGIITTVAGSGSSASTNNAGDGKYATAANLVLPYDVSISPAGDMVITDQKLESIRTVTPSGNFGSTATGSTAPAQTVYALTAVSGTFSFPSGTPDFSVGATSCALVTALGGQVCSATVTFAPTAAGLRQASLSFTDATTIVIKQTISGTGVAGAVAELPGMINTIAGTGTADDSGDGAAAVSATLNEPSAVAVDAAGNTYIADTQNNVIREIASDGTISRFAGTGTTGAGSGGGLANATALNAPHGVAVDGAGNVYIADTGNNLVRVVNAVGKIISTLAGTGTAGYTGDNGAATAATLSGPTGLSVTANGELYVADSGNNTVRVIGLRSGLITTFAGNGTAGLTTAGSAAFGAPLRTPTAVVVGLDGTVYFTESGNSQIRAIGSDGALRTIAGTGTPGFLGDGSAMDAPLSVPAGLAIDAAGDLYVADTGNQRIRVIASGQIKTIAGDGNSTFTGSNVLSTLASLNAPQGIALDAAGNLVIADQGNNAVRKISVSGATITFPKTNPSNNSDPQTISLLNTGNQLLNVAGVAIAGPFSQTPSGSADCAATGQALMAGAFCNTQIVFNSPATLGSSTGSLTFTDDVSGVTGTTQVVVLTGTTAATFKAIITLPATVTSGVPFNVTVNVTSPSSTYTGTIVFGGSDAKAVYPTGSSLTFTTADAGTKTYQVTLTAVGIQSVSVKDTADSTVTSSTTTTVTAGPAAAISVYSGSGQSAELGTNFGSPLVVQVTDAAGNPVANAAVMFTTPSSGPHAVFDSTPVTTNSSGLASLSPVTADYLIGSYKVTATVAGISQTAQFSLTNTSAAGPDFTMTPDTNLVITVLPGAAYTQNITITPTGGFYAAVNFTCSTSDTSITCSFIPATTTPTDGTPQAVKFTVQTSGPNRTGGNAVRHGAMLAGLLFFSGIFLRRKKLPLALALLILAVPGFAALTGCGGSNSNTTSNSRTKDGVYTATVTATSGSISHSTTIQYWVSGD